MTRSYRMTGTALAAASLLALLEIFRTTVVGVLEGRTVRRLDLIFVVPMWITIVLLSPWCAFMARRFPFERGRLVRATAAHLAGAALFVAMQMALMIATHTLLHNAEFLWHGLLRRYVFYILMEMSVYAAIVLVVLLFDARREAGERALLSARLERSLTQARLESLRAQIRPHFLFNTLNALAVLARKGDGAAVDRAIGDLGELLRASFEERDGHEIPLGEELEFVERYLSLQRIRFPHRLEVDWQVAPETRHALVPALLVQPLVENALEHGLASARGGHLTIGARRDGDALEIEVADDGPGFNGADSASGGVGLANIRERLSLLYGTRGALGLGDRPGGGGIVRVRIPWRVAGVPSGADGG